MQRWRPTLSPDFAASARAGAIDVAAAVTLFVIVSLAAGRVLRFPFDDELIALAPVEHAASALNLLISYLNGADIHPPLSFMLFYWLHIDAGMSEAGVRLCSLAMTALALALFHCVALTMTRQCGEGPVAPATRLITVLLFGLCPLAVSQGDAIRWYPPFAALIAIFTVLYLFGGNRAAVLMSAVPLGLAASTNFLAAIVILPLIAFRYGLQRSFRLRFEVCYWAIFAALASAGAITAYSVFSKRFTHVMGTEFGHGVAQAVAIELLGFFGGDALGISLAWIVVPAVAITAAAMISSIDRRRPSHPVNFLLLMLAASALMVLPGFAKPRSFLYLAPVVAVLLALLLDRLVRQDHIRRVLAVAALLMAANVAAIANIGHSSHPFKRESVIPYQSILDFIADSGTGHVLVISTDPIVPWVLDHRPSGDVCANYYLETRACLESARRYDSIFIVHGHSERSEKTQFMGRFNDRLKTITASRKKLATLHAGRDEDAALKSRLTGVPLTSAILTVDLYR